VSEKSDLLSAGHTVSDYHSSCICACCDFKRLRCMTTTKVLKYDCLISGMVFFLSVDRHEDYISVDTDEV